MFKTRRSFGREIYNDNLSLDDALEQKIFGIFKESTRPKQPVKKEQKNTTS